MKVAILTKDIYLFRRIELELQGHCETVPYGDPADVLIIDSDTENAAEFDGRLLRLSRRDADADLPIPFLRGKLLSYVKNGASARLTLDPLTQTAILDGASVKLTGQESALLGFLMSKRGEFASREEISREVWGGASDGLINIYIHYLREKLERSGEKIIISSRSHGYKISEKYLEVSLC